MKKQIGRYKSMKKAVDKIDAKRAEHHKWIEIAGGALQSNVNKLCATNR